MKTIDLRGAWQIRSTDGFYTLDATMPGSLFAALEEQGVFGPEGIFWRENNRRCQEIADRDFLFSREFNVDPAFLAEPSSKSPIFLECEGLDTLATIRLNGSEIARTINMHRRYSFEIGGKLISGKNHIEILFANSLAYCREQRKRRDLWHVYEPTPEIAAPGFNMIRKSHCGFGWDWGPIVPDVGIWRSIRIARYDVACLKGLRIIQNHTGTPEKPAVSLKISGLILRFSDSPIRLSATLTHPSGHIQTIDSPADADFIIEVQNPRLWWPNGLGDQPLYLLQVALRADGQKIHELLLTIGLRTLTVRRQPDQWGESFEFQVNGQSFFAMGADYIPEDIALSRVSRERTSTLIRDAALANFNCLRVWGGGVYPSEDFYDLCDQYGLVVWQDLMFACATYDLNNPEFRDEILAEVRDNLERLRHRASLGLICGNNEMEWGFEVWDIRRGDELRQEYLRQYEELFPALVKEICPEVFYWPASPSSGGGFNNPNSPDAGDCHYWEVWHGNKDFQEFTKHYFRFMSEFGFESLPTMKTIESFSLPQDLNLLSPVMEDHQRCLNGNQKILSHMSKYFRYPSGFENVVYVSQISQAEALRTGIEHWRRNRGRCMGSVYWQLNDNWPVASWSSIDHEGRWKALHYVVRRAYAPVLISVSPLAIGGETFASADSPVVALYLSNESWNTVWGTLSWRLIDLIGTVRESGQSRASAPAFGISPVLELDFTGRLNDHSRGKGFSPNNQALLSYEYRLDSGETLSGIHCFAPYKALELQPAQLKANVRQINVENGKSVFAVDVFSPVPALFVEVGHTKADPVFTDNYFHLDGTTGRTITVIRRADKRDIAAFANDLTLRSLRDSY